MPPDVVNFFPVLGDLAKAALNLAEGVDVNWRVKEDDLWSGLHYAVDGNHGDLVDLILSQPRVDINIKTAHNATPLIVGCSEGYENIIRKLLQVKDIKLNCRCSIGNTALHYTASGNFSTCVELL